jgi:hypothetical protein
VRTKYKDLSEDAVTQHKIRVLDSIGCAVPSSAGFFQAGQKNEPPISCGQAVPNHGFIEYALLQGVCGSFDFFTYSKRFGNSLMSHAPVLCSALI